ncbi:hypothetical protein, partial [Leptospira idonii]|uniref:hypothetical protein n=1 Tax=Leptospira idonii TaxID=1193500 RepID=UPI0014386570
ITFNDQQPFISLHKKYSSTITQSHKPTLKEVRDALHDQIISSISSPEAKFTLIKSDVGTGKSYFTNSLPKIFSNKRILVLVKRIENYTNFSNFTSLPSIPKQLEDFFEENSSKGIHSYKIFEDLEPTTPRLKSLKEIYLKHKKSTEDILATNQFIVATHSKFFLSSLNSQNFDHVIFDECLIDSMFRDSFVKANELTALRSEKSFLIKDLLKSLDEMEIGEIKSFLNPSLTTKINNLLEAETEKLVKHLSRGTHPPNSSLSVLKHFQNEFHVLKLKNEYQVLSNFQFPSSSSKYLILSATASSEIYKELFKNEIE